MTDPLRDSSLLEAMRIPTTLVMVVWLEALHKHRGHPTFKIDNRPLKREYGFTCECTGAEEYFGIDIRAMRERLPEARVAFDRFLREMRHQSAQSTKAAKADKRAKALLFRYLTRDQKTMLRVEGYVEVRGQDGHIYRVGGYNGVKRVEGGIETWSFCLHAEDQLPRHDLMLAQKVYLESNIQAFLEMANKRELKPEPEPKKTEDRDRIWDSISREDVNDIEGWAMRHQGITP